MSESTPPTDPLRPLYSRCPRCGAPVSWAFGADGAMVPMDVLHRPDGPFVIVGMNGPFGSGLYALSSVGRLETEARHTSHLVTCTRPMPTAEWPK